MRALIAVAGRPLPAEKIQSWHEDAVAMQTTYVESLHRADAQEAILAPRPIDDQQASELLDRFQGLLLVGGGDIDPKHYGQDPGQENYGVNPEADLFEMTLVRTAAQRRMPILAICRGIQILNVALGGTLDQHITGREGLVGHGVPGVAPEMHQVRLEPGTWTAKAMGAESALVSSSHHQALDRVAEKLVITGRAPDGIVEAVEYPSDGWVVGVQWHPERTPDDPAHQGLFDALVEQAASE